MDSLASVHASSPIRSIVSTLQASWKKQHELSESIQQQEQKLIKSFQPPCKGAEEHDEFNKLQDDHEDLKMQLDAANSSIMNLSALLSCFTSTPWEANGDELQRRNWQDLSAWLRSYLPESRNKEVKTSSQLTSAARFDPS